MVTIPLGTSDWRRNITEAPYIKLRNRYFESNPANQVEQQALLARPALQRWLTVGAGPNRGLFSQPGAFNDALFVMSGAMLYKVLQDETVELIGNSFFAGGDETTRASMTAVAALGSTPEKLFIADGEKLRVYQPETFARGELLASGAIANNDQVRIGSSYYVFVNGSVDSGSPNGTSGNPWKVAHTANNRTNLENLLNAINATGTPGTTYTTSLTANASAVATGSTIDTLFVRASVVGPVGNSVATTETGANMAWGAATLTGGLDDGLTIVDVPAGLAAVSVASIAGYAIVVPKQTEGFIGRFYWIEPGDTTILPNNFATAERAADPLVSVRTIGDQFALFGTSNVEFWYPTGDFIAPFARSQGRLFERGVWENTDVQIKDTLVVMDTDGVVYRIDGGGPQRISDHSVEERTRAAIKNSITQTAPGGGSGGGPLSVVWQDLGQSTSSTLGSQVYTANLALVSGGVGPYAYRSYFINQVNGTFSFLGSNTAPLVTPQVSGVPISSTGTATLICEVTDANGTVVTTVAGANYSHQNTSVVPPPPPPPPLTVTVSYTVSNQSGTNNPNFTFANNTATPSGGTGPYTYSWYFVQQSSGTWSLTNAGSATVTPSVSGVLVTDTAVAEIRCLVTDSLGATGLSPSVFLYYTNNSGGGPPL